MPKTDKGRNAKPLWNVPELVDKAIEHYAKVHNLSWANALYQLVIMGYSEWVKDPANGYHYLFDDKAFADVLMDELDAQGLKGQTLTAFLMDKAFVKQGRPKSE